MSIFVAPHHVTHYKYDRPIDLGPQTIRLRPAPHTRTPILSYSLKVTPPNHFVNWQQDPQGNWLARYVFPEKASELKIEVDFTAQMTVVNPFDFFVEPYVNSFPFGYPDGLKTELAPYLETIAPGPLFSATRCVSPVIRSTLIIVSVGPFVSTERTTYKSSPDGVALLGAECPECPQAFDAIAISQQSVRRSRGRWDSVPFVGKRIGAMVGANEEPISPSHRCAGRCRAGGCASPLRRPLPRRRVRLAVVTASSTCSASCGSTLTVAALRARMRSN